MGRYAGEMSGREAGTTAPVVVTLSADGRILDVVGDLGWFTDGSNSHAQTVQRLLDLVEGSSEAPDVIPAVELANGRFADIHVVVEEDTRHFVLIDVSGLMQGMRRRQQSDNELALQQERQYRSLIEAKQPLPDGMGQTRYRGFSMLTALVADMRAPLVQIVSQARTLERRFVDDPTTLRSIASILGAALRLDAVCANGMLISDEDIEGAADVDRLDTRRLAAFIHDTFGLQARVQGCRLEVRVPQPPIKLAIDARALRQVLVNLLLHALDGFSGRTLVVALSMRQPHRALDVEIACEPCGFDEARFASLVTATSAGAPLELVVSRAVLQQMQAEAELVALQTGGVEVWCRIPVLQQESAEQASPEHRSAKRLRRDG